MGEDEIKISELNNANLVNDEDTLMIIQNGTNKKITIENLLNAEREKNTKLEEEIEKLKNTTRNILTIKKGRGSINYNTAWEGVVLVGSEYSKIGEKLSVENGKIKIGAGVNKILISGHCCGYDTSKIGNDKGFSIRKNGTEIASNYLGAGLSAYYQGATISPILIDVVEGDELSMNVYAGTTGTISLLESFLTAEVVE